jgi:methyl-accepting chemotaxis protein
MSIFDDIGSFVSDITKKAVDAVVDAGTKVVDTVDSQKDNIAHTVVDVNDKIKDGIDTAVNTVTDNSSQEKK